eukprot:TRINITY_DN7420_c0_g1_i1.p1 TRINITY_DN7420_c0_g1~~TRINITY_DN7420_c0_g1_i1.p1  ORF type:complete len:384 (-),score=56.03 TRINITY_DN7420_c0_g1_i1:3699-4850(-)
MASTSSSPRGPQDTPQSQKNRSIADQEWDDLIIKSFESQDRYTLEFHRYTLTVVGAGGSLVEMRPPVILGRGGQGVVVLARDHGRHAEFVAIKLMRQMHVKISEQSRREVVNHARLSHMHVVQFYRVFRAADLLCISMQYVNGGSLFELIKKKQCRFEVRHARFFFWELMFAVKYCHGQGVWIRDLKLQNILLQGNHLLICDMGMSKAVQNSQPNTKTGTPYNLSPEIITQPQYEGETNDVWCCGIILWCMIMGHYIGPFYRQGDEYKKEWKLYRDIIDRVVCEKQHFLDGAVLGFEPAIEKLLRGMFTRDPQERLTVQQVMSDPWFLEGLDCDLVQRFERDAERSCGREQSDQEIQQVLNQVEEEMFYPTSDFANLDEFQNL